MPHPDCYYEYIRGWETNEGGVLINDPRLNPWIIPALESEEVRIGSFPRYIAEVQPSMFLDLATVVAVWEEKHIAVARMIITGVTRTPVRKSKQALAKLQAGGATLKHEDYFSWRTFLSYLTGIYTRDWLDECIQKMQNGYFPTYHHIHGRAVQPTGCILFIHSQLN